MTRWVIVVGIVGRTGGRPTPALQRPKKSSLISDRIVSAALAWLRLAIASPASISRRAQPEHCAARCRAAPSTDDDCSVYCYWAASSEEASLVPEVQVAPDRTVSKASSKAPLLLRRQAGLLLRREGEALLVVVVHLLVPLYSTQHIMHQSTHFT